VSPPTWSHATFVATTLKVVREMIKFRGAPEYDLRIPEHDMRKNWIEEMFSEVCDTIYGMCKVT
jgi:hypothetical protein